MGLISNEPNALWSAFNFGDYDSGTSSSQGFAGPSYKGYSTSFPSAKNYYGSEKAGLEAFRNSGLDADSWGFKAPATNELVGENVFGDQKRMTDMAGQTLSWAAAIEAAELQRKAEERAARARAKASGRAAMLGAIGSIGGAVLGAAI